MAVRPDPDHTDPAADAVHHARRRVRVSIGSGHDDAVVVKTGDHPAAIVAVEREALVLGQLRHPNIVDLVRTERTDTTATLVTHYAGPTTLAEISVDDAADVARFGAALLTIVGDLHAMGWAHGRVRADHCIVGDDGRLTLCAFGAAHRIAPRDPRRATDIADAVAVIAGLIDRCADDLVEHGDRASRRRLRHVRAALATATTSPPTAAAIERLRSTLTTISGAVATAPPADPAITLPSLAALERRDRDATTRPAGANPRRRWRGIAAATAALVGLFGAVVFLRWVGGPLGGASTREVARVGDLPAPVLLALTVIRVVAFAAALYGIALTTATLAALLTRRADVARLATAMAPPRLRQALVGLIGLGVLSSAATGPAPTPDPAVASAAPAPSTSTTSSTPPPTTAVAPPATAPVPPPPSPATAPPSPATASPPTADAPTTPLPNLWVMAPGDHLWGVAAEALARHYQRPARNDEIDGYWRRLVEMNRGSLIDPDNPDLVFAGQVIELPTID